MYVWYVHKLQFTMRKLTSYSLFHHLCNWDVTQATVYTNPLFYYSIKVPEQYKLRFRVSQACCKGCWNKLYWSQQIQPLCIVAMAVQLSNLACVFNFLTTPIKWMCCIFLASFLSIPEVTQSKIPRPGLIFFLDEVLTQKFFRACRGQSSPNFLVHLQWSSEVWGL
jgi:hypothetical protein